MIPPSDAEFINTVKEAAKLVAAVDMGASYDVDDDPEDMVDWHMKFMLALAYRGFLDFDRHSRDAKDVGDEAFREALDRIT